MTVPQRGSDDDSHASTRAHIEAHASVDDWMRHMAAPKNQLRSEHVQVQYVSDKPYALEMTTEIDIITLKLGPTRGVKAWNTDRVTPLEAIPGRAFLFPAGSSVYSHANVASSFPLIGISKSFREDIRNEFGKGAEIPFDRIHENVPSPSFLPLAYSVRNALSNELLTGGRAADAIGVMVMSEVLRTVANWDPTEHVRRLDDRRLSATFAYIEEKLADRLETSDLAALNDLSVFHFTRAFKTTTGSSPYQFILERRVERARNLLESTTETLADIAYSVGFSSQAHMTSVFQKRLGVTPGRYRKTYRL